MRIHTTFCGVAVLALMLAGNGIPNKTKNEKERDKEHQHDLNRTECKPLGAHFQRQDEPQDSNDE